MTRRPGLTLVETLVAMFVAALGMIGILTLFPLGALQMGQALKDGRTAQAAQEADGMLRWYFAKYELSSSAQSPILLAFDRADGLTNNTQWASATTGTPSFPVYIDPLGAVAPSPGNKTRVADLQTLPRRTLTEPTVSGSTLTYPSLLNTNSRILRFSMLQDDLTFSDSKTGAPASAAVVERGGRYTWAWLVQRPDNSRRGSIDLKVVVYDQRAPFYANDLSETRYPSLADVNNSAKQVRMTPGLTSLTVPYTGVRPPLSKGRWVCDATFAAGTQPLRHANFYRVVSVNEETPGQLILELETPIRRSDGRNTEADFYNGTLVILNGVADVFDRPAIVMADAP